MIVRFLRAKHILKKRVANIYIVYIYDQENEFLISQVRKGTAVERENTLKNIQADRRMKER
jgi:hypothetical protein